MTTTDDTAAVLAFAHRLADAAADVILPYFRSAMTVEDKGDDGRNRGYDPVTQADRGAERAMRALIAQAYPGHGILGEEEGHTPGAEPGHWVLDPIDGTRAFITGLPLWGTLIAFNDGTRPILGIMDQPFTGERFCGGPDGAFLGDRRLVVASCPALAQAKLMSTGPYLFGQPGEWEAFQAVSAKARLTRFGGDCYAYCMVAMGQVDAIVEAGLKPYDVQALIPIVEAAGGIMTTWDGGDAQSGGRIVACGDRRLHEEILATLNADRKWG